MENKNTSKPKIQIGRRAGDVVFPRSTVKQSLKVAETIWSKNSGNPIAINDLAKQMRLSVHGGSFKNIVRSSHRYGITNGSYSQKSNSTISLSDLGTSLVEPIPSDNVQELMIKALMSIEIYNKLIKSMVNKIIPPDEMLENVLKRNHHVVDSDKSPCCKIFLKNLEELNLIDKRSDGNYLMLPDPSMSNDAEKDDQKQIDDGGIGDTETSNTPSIKNKQIFVAHGKNLKALEQLKTILQRFDIPFTVAIDESNSGRPISKKISDLMNSCSSAIFIFTKDEETINKNGDNVYRPSDNVVYELGAASILYGKKIVIFKEKGVSFGSDFTDLGYISFEDDELDAKGMDLIKELMDLGLFKINLT